MQSVQLGAAIPHSVLYLQGAHLKARPKPISGRTSYLRVRLEFHRYPQVIPSRFLVSGFGPPFCVTKTSTCSWIDHSVSGLLLHTMSPYSDSLSLRLRLSNLTLHATVTRRFILQKARHHPLTGSDFLYISLPSRGSFHLSLSVLVHYRSLESI